MLRARIDRMVRGVATGLFFGMLPGAAAAALAGSVSLPFPALAIAGIAAGAGAMVGGLIALLRRCDRRRLLIEADRSLGSRELASTALELADRPAAGAFSEAVIEDAAGLLSRAQPRVILGRLSIPLLPWIPAVALLTALALFFPFDLRSLLGIATSGPRKLAMIGEDLQRYGQRLQDAARSQNLGRSLALSQELTQLGRDFARGSIREEEALDRIGELERGLAAEYDLRLRPGNGGPADQSRAEQGLKDLRDAMQRLRDARREAASPGHGGEGTDKAPSAGQNPNEKQQGQGADNLPPGAGNLPPGGNDGGKGSSGMGSESGPPPRESRESAVGSTPGAAPAPEDKGPPTSIARGSQGPLLRAEAAPGEGDAAKLLVRSLPEWTRSRMPEDQIIQRYAQQAESALAKDEIPPKLREYVKGYFTIIAMPRGEKHQ